MTRKELLNLVIKSESRKSEDIYNRVGLDSISKTFLHSLKLNQCHQNRKRIFEDYAKYEQRY